MAERTKTGREAVAGGARKKAAASAKKKTARKAAAKKPTGKKEPREPTPRGPRLSAAQQGLRDSLMVARQAQGWTLAEIAAEAGISVSQVKRAVAARRDALPIRLNMDPAKVIEAAFEGFMLSIADFERIAVEAAAKDWLAVAVGAKRSANEAREKALALMQSTGNLPANLGDLRHLMDLRRIAQDMLDAVGEFREAIEAGEPPLQAAARVEGVFNRLIGIEEQDRLPAAAA